MQTQQPKITVVGSLNVDFIFQIHKLPSMGESVVGGQFKQTYGGKGANQAVAAARLGGDVTFVGSVGDDVYGKQIIANFNGEGIDTRHLNVVPNCETGAAGIMFDREGNNYLAVASGANYAVTADDIERAAPEIESAGAILLQMEITAAASARAIEIASRAKVPVYFNFAPARLNELEIDGHVTGLLVNETEAAALSGLPCDSLDDARSAALQLLTLGCRFVVVTLGKNGAIVADENGIDHVPSYPIAPVDATAAGDVFCGCLALEMCRGLSLRDACPIANAAAALSVTRAGAQPSIPSAADLRRFLSEMGSA